MLMPPAAVFDVHAPIYVLVNGAPIHLESLGWDDTPTSWDAWAIRHEAVDLLRKLRQGMPPDEQQQNLCKISEPFPINLHLQELGGGVNPATLEGYLRRQEGQVALLLAHGAKPNHQTLSHAVHTGNPRLVHRLLQAASHLDWSLERLKRLGQEDFFGTVPTYQSRTVSLFTESPLLAATFRTRNSESARIAAMMLDAGTPIDMIDPSMGNTPLMWAVSWGNLEVVDLLLQRGAQPNVGNRRGHTAMHLAACYNHPLIMGLLLNHGARLDHDAALDITAEFGDPYGPREVGRLASLGRQLLNDKENLAAGRRMGPLRDTPMVQAAHAGAGAAIAWLIEQGVEPCPRLDASNPHGPRDERVLGLLQAGHRRAVEELEAMPWVSRRQIQQVEAGLRNVEQHLLRQAMAQTLETLNTAPSARGPRRL